MRAGQNTHLIALDATRYFSSSSKNIHCPEHLSSLLATMNLRAFALHPFLELADADYQLIRTPVGARRMFFEHLRALTMSLHFENWTRLLDFMRRGWRSARTPRPKS